MLVAAFTLASALLAGVLGQASLLQQLELKTYDARLRAVATGEGAAAGHRAGRSSTTTRSASSSRSSAAGRGRGWCTRCSSTSWRAGRRRWSSTTCSSARSDKGTTDIGGTTWTGAESGPGAGRRRGRGRQRDPRWPRRRARALVEANAERAAARSTASRRCAARWPLAGFAERRPLLVAAVSGAGAGRPRHRPRARGLRPRRSVRAATCRSWRSTAASCRRCRWRRRSRPAASRPTQVVGVARRAALGDVRVPWVEQVVPDYYGPAQTVWRRLVPFRGPTMRADQHADVPSYSFQDLFLAEQQLLAGETPHLDPAVFKDRIVVVGVDRRGPARTSSPRRSARAACPAPRCTPTCIDGLLADRTIAPAAPWQRAGRHARAGAGDRRRRRAGGAVGHRGGARWRRRRPLAWYATRALGARRVAAAGRAGAGLRCSRSSPTWRGCYFVEGREKRRVKRLFSRYVSKDVYQQLLASPSDVGAGRRAARDDGAVLGHARFHHAVGERRGRRPGPAAEPVLHADGGRWCSRTAAPSTSSSATW